MRSALRASCSAKSFLKVANSACSFAAASGPIDSKDPRQLEAHVLKTLRVVSELPQGQLRRDALSEVSRLRRRAIELRHRAAAEIKAQMAARHPRAHLREVK